MRTVVCAAGIFLCLASSGCQQYIANQISPQASTYNSAVSKATSQQLLDNIAGVYNHEMPAFMDVSYVTIGNNYTAPSLMLDQSALNYPGNFFSGMSAELGLSPPFWSPTVGFTPSSGSQMVKPLFAPFTLSSLSEVIYSHTNINLLLHLLIKRITPIGSQESINLGRHKEANLSDKDQRNVNNLFNLIQKIYKQNGLQFDLINANYLTEGVDVSFDGLITDGHSQIASKNSSAKTEKTKSKAVEEGFVKPKSIEQPYILVFRIPKGMTFTERDKAAMKAFGVPLNAQQIALKTPFYSSSDISAITVSLRSLYSMVVYLANHVSVDDRPVFPGAPIIYKTDELPVDAYLESYYKGSWYSIKENDTKTLRTLETLKLLYGFSMAQSSFANLSSTQSGVTSSVVGAGSEF